MALTGSRERFTDADPVNSPDAPTRTVFISLARLG